MCCFDKTGTLTSDNLDLLGVVGEQLLSVSVEGADDGVDPTGPVKRIVPCCASKIRSLPSMVLGACHDLLMIEGKLTGDPMEIAMVSGVRLARAIRSNNQTTHRLPPNDTASPSLPPLQR